MATEAADGLDNLLAFFGIAARLMREILVDYASVAGRQLLRLGLRPKVFRDRIDLRHVSFVPVRCVIGRSAPSIIVVPPELRHARFRLELLRIGQPLADPLLGKLSGNGRKIRPDLSDVFVARDLVATEAAIDADEIATVIQRSGFWNFRAGVVAFVAAGLDVVHRVHRRFQELLFMPLVFLLPLLPLLFAARHVSRILKTRRAIQTVVARRTAERFHRMRRG